MTFVQHLKEKALDHAIYPGPLEHPRYQVIPRPSDKLDIFFAGAGVEDSRFHWWKMAQRIDASVILVNNGRNEWYMHGIPGLRGTYEETIEGFRAWASPLDATEIYTCGGSMGGSGALVYGVPLGARVLGMGFETHLNSPWGNVQRVMLTDGEPPFRDFGPLVEKATQRIVVYAGESEPVDLLGAAHIADLPLVETITLRQVGHGPPAHLRNRKRLDPIFDAFLNDEPLPGVPNAGNGLTPGFPEALYAGYSADREKRWVDVEAQARKALNLYPRSEFAMMLLGKGLLHQKRLPEAISALKTAVEMHRQSQEARFLLAHTTEHAGDVYGAVALHKAILDEWPNFGRSHYSLGRIYASKNSWKSALSRLRKAVECDPQRTNFREELERVEKRALAAGYDLGKR